ncbi:phosphatidylserine decarboxylase [Clostridium culturomicium]|uniref:phosphatidylserine decarboxylase n=1 Tax=Clostridium culturomicium TaxID=1499683 RepID=UPI00059153A7|nr:phosphatidylserine decarboxylase [Clostridium culturomicium]
MVKYYNRQTKQYEEENVAGKGAISLIYSNPIGNNLLPKLASKKVLTDFYGKFCNLKLSRIYIKKFVKKFNIDMTEYEKDIKDFKSFNDFFYRELSPKSRVINNNKSEFISPCDGKLLAIEHMDSNSSFRVKGFKYTLDDLIQDKSLSKLYKNGTCLIFRLCPTDYHRFHFIDSGICTCSSHINGRYYSVNPVALKNIDKVFTENKREYSILKSDNFDDIIYVEVGATFVGSIVQTYQPDIKVTKGSEKGYFKFGGSTVILLLKEGIITLDKDIKTQSILGIETSVKLGEKIGVRL